MTFLHASRLRPVVLSAALVLAACNSFSGPQYSQAAVDQATVLKAESLALLGQANEAFADHATESELLLAKAEAAEAGAAGVPGNEAVFKQWQLITDPGGNLLGGTLGRWEDQGTLQPVFRDEISAQVADAFDILICTEESKLKPKACGPRAAGGN